MPSGLAVRYSSGPQAGYLIRAFLSPRDWMSSIFPLGSKVVFVSTVSSDDTRYLNPK